MVNPPFFGYYMLNLFSAQCNKRSAFIFFDTIVEFIFLFFIFFDIMLPVM